jgi:hypothetical protein
MRPAFSSTRQAAVFALLLLLLLLSPVLIGKRLLPPRETIYTSTCWRLGSYPFLYQQIFKETNEIDVAVIGSSKGWFDLDAVHLQAELSQRLGRQAVVLNLCWKWAGYDATYFITRDLLEHRRVKMLVFTDEQPPGFSSDGLHRSQCVAHHWFRFGDGAPDIAGLTLPNQASLYGSAILGLPRNLLCLARPNLDLISGTNYQPSVNAYYMTPDPFARLGSLRSAMDYFEDPHFVLFQPAASHPAAVPLIYSSANRTNFQFTGPRTHSMELFFLKKFTALAADWQVKLVMLHYPMYREPEPQERITERECWPDIIGTNVTLMGVVPSRFCAGVTPAQKRQIFCNDFHLNQNGQDHFTRMITPALIDIYESETRH